MMDYEQGFQNGLRIALIAIHRMQREQDKAEFLEAIVNSAIAESEKRQMKELDKMRENQTHINIEMKSNPYQMIETENGKTWLIEYKED